MKILYRTENGQRVTRNALPKDVAKLLRKGWAEAIEDAPKKRGRPVKVEVIEDGLE